MPSRSSGRDGGRGIVLRTLTEDEQSARQAALADARLREEEERRAAEAEAARRNTKEFKEQQEREAENGSAVGERPMDEAVQHGSALSGVGILVPPGLALEEKRKEERDKEQAADDFPKRACGRFFMGIVRRGFFAAWGNFRAIGVVFVAVGRIQGLLEGNAAAAGEGQ